MISLVFGTGGRFGRLNSLLAYKLIDYAIENGIQYFDTGLTYASGNSQKLLFKSLKPYLSNSSIRISTKLPLNCSFDYAIHQLTSSVELLSPRNYIDTLFLWGPNAQHLYSQPLIQKLVGLKNMGVIKKIGVNTHSLAIMSYLLESPFLQELDSIMLDFNLVQQDRLHFIRTFSALGKEVWAGTSLCQGFLIQSLHEMFFRTRSFSYLARALLNKPTRDLRYRSRRVRGLLRSGYPDLFAEAPLAYVCSFPEVTHVPIGMLSCRSIDKNVAISKSIYERNFLDDIANYGLS